MLRVFVDGPIALGAVIWSPLRTTLIAKASFALLDGAFEMEAVPPALSLDAFDDEGEVVYPTDFAPYKPACDVVVGGAAARERHAPGHVTIGAFARTVEANESLGPRESFCPSGDPSDPEVHSTWVSGGMEFTRFQCAGPRQRMAWPAAPFDIDLVRTPLALRGRWGGPSPSVLLEAPGGGRIQVAMPLDTVVLLATEARLIVLWRAVLDTQAPGEHRVYVQLPRSGAPTPAWAEVVPSTAGPLRVRSPSFAELLAQPIEGTAAASGIAAMRWPFQAGDDATTVAPAPSSGPERTTSLAFRTPARTLPFQKDAGEAAPGSAPPPRAAPADFVALRSEGERQVWPAWQAGAGTASIRAARPEPSPSPSPSPFSASPSPFSASPSPSPSLSAFSASPSPSLSAFSPSPSPGFPLRQPAPQESIGGGSPAGPFALASPAVIAQERSPEALAVSTGPSADTVAAIQREIWKGERELAMILLEYGVTEGAWRQLRRPKKVG